MVAPTMHTKDALEMIYTGMTRAELNKIYPNIALADAIIISVKIITIIITTTIIITPQTVPITPMNSV